MKTFQWNLKSIFILQKKVINEIKNLLFRDKFDSKALIILSPLINTYIPWTGSAIRPNALRIILNEILIHNRKVIVELGSGISTVLLEAFLRGSVVDIYTIDNDSDWQEKVKKMIILNGGDPAIIKWINSDMVMYEGKLSSSPWYDLSVKNILPNNIDLLIVDGPVSSPKNKFIRYPALPELISKMSYDCCIVLDDSNREGESEIASLWAEDYSLNIIDLKYEGDFVFLVRGDCKRYNVI